MSHRFNSQLGEGNASRQEYRGDVEERAEAFGWRSNEKGPPPQILPASHVLSRCDPVPQAAGET